MSHLPAVFAMLLTLPTSGAALAVDSPQEQRTKEERIADTPLAPALLLLPRCSEARLKAPRHAMCSAFNAHIRERIRARMTNGDVRGVTLDSYDASWTEKSSLLRSRQQKIDVSAEALEGHRYVLVVGLPDIHTRPHPMNAFRRIPVSSSIVTVRVFLNDGAFTPLGERTLFGEDNGTLTDERAVQDMPEAADRVYEGMTDRRCPVVPDGRCAYSFNLSAPKDAVPRFNIVRDADW